MIFFSTENLLHSPSSLGVEWFWMYSGCYVGSGSWRILIYLVIWWWWPWCSVMSDSLQHCGRWPARLLCPWDVPGKNTEVGYHFLLQGIFLTQGWNLHLLNWQADSLPLTHLGSVALLYVVFYYVGIPLFIYPFSYPRTLVYFLFYVTTICIAMNIVKEGEYLLKYFFALGAFFFVEYLICLFLFFHNIFCLFKKMIHSSG